MGGSLPSTKQGTWDEGVRIRGGSFWKLWDGMYPVEYSGRGWFTSLDDVVLLLFSVAGSSKQGFSRAGGGPKINDLGVSWICFGGVVHFFCLGSDRSSVLGFCEILWRTKTKLAGVA